MTKQAETKAGHVVAVDGEVVQLGPGAVALSMTPGAAAETGRRLTEAATLADGPGGSGGGTLEPGGGLDEA